MRRGTPFPLAPQEWGEPPGPWAWVSVRASLGAPFFVPKPQQEATLEPTPEAKAIAHGQPVIWERTFPHPEHGDLKFRVPRPPRVRDWLEHAQRQEQIASGVTGANAVLAAACAGMYTFMDVPVIREDRKEDPDNPDHVTVTKVYYDPLDDENVDFPVEVWIDWVNWRLALASKDTKEQVKNSSEATDGGPDSGPSLATTASPQPTTV